MHGSMNIKCINYGLFYSKTFDNLCLKYFLLNLIPLEVWVRILLKVLRNDGNALTGLKILQIVYSALMLLALVKEGLTDHVTRITISL
jgi:hypothetical protein